MGWEKGEEAQWKNNWHYPDTADIQLYVEQLDINQVSKNLRNRDVENFSGKEKNTMKTPAKLTGKFQVGEWDAWGSRQSREMQSKRSK